MDYGWLFCTIHNAWLPNARCKAERAMLIADAELQQGCRFPFFCGACERSFGLN